MDENVYGNLNKDLDENLPWLTQKTEDLKNNNKGNPTLTPPPFSGSSPLSRKNFCTSRSDSIFGRSYPPSGGGRAGGEEGAPTMLEKQCFAIA